MAVSDDIQRHRGLSHALDFTRVTLIGGALFLLPIVVVVIVLGKVLGLMAGLTEPLAKALGVKTIAGVAVSHLLTISALVLTAFLAGLLARTKAGQRVLIWIRQGVSAVIPQFGVLEDVARNVGHDENLAEMPIVLVPTDAGWSLGMLLESEGDWHAVFLPSAPQMASGSVAYAHTDHIHRTNLTLTQLWVMLRARGKGSSTIYHQLAVLDAEGRLPRP